VFQTCVPLQISDPLQIVGMGVRCTAIATVSIFAIPPRSFLPAHDVDFMLTSKLFYFRDCGVACTVYCTVQQL